MCRSTLSLSKIAHQMWHDHPFSQRNRTTERVAGVGWTKFGKRRGLGNIGGSSKNCGVNTLYVKKC